MELLGFIAVIVIGGLMIIPTKIDDKMDNKNEEIEKETETE